MASLHGMLLAVDRTMALFVGIAVGAIVAFSFRDSVPSASPAHLPAPVIPAPAPTTPAPVVAAMPGAQSDPSAPAAPVAAPRSDARPPASRLAAAVAEARPIRIGVFGDSFGEGVWAGLYNRLRGDSGFEVYQFAERSTGFTRYRSLNILDDVRAKLARQPVDVAILSFGANDVQGIWDGERGHAFMTESWQAIVAGRVGEVVTLLRDSGAAVYWVGLPRMRDAAYDADVQAMNRFYAERMAALGVLYLDTVPLSVDAQGRYAPYLPAEPGQARRIARENDGIHMTIPGYVHLTGELTDRLRESVDQARAQAAAGLPSASTGEGRDSGSQG